MSERNHRNMYFGLAMVFASAGLSGCVHTLTPAKMTDSSSPWSAATLVVRPESWRPTEDKRHWGGIEFGYEHQSGTGAQDIDADKYVTHDIDNDFIGPQTVHHAVKVDHGHVAYNRLYTFGPHFELEPAWGVAYDSISIRTEGIVKSTISNQVLGRQEIHFHQNVLGATGSITPRWNFNQYFAVEALVRVGVGVASHSDSVSIYTLRNSSFTVVTNPSLVFRPSKNLALSVGYAERAQSIGNREFASPTELEFSGFSATLRVNL